MRYIADYLTLDVLDGLDAKTRAFMLGTCILDRFTAKLCDAVLCTTDSARVLTDAFPESRAAMLVGVAGVCSGPLE